MNQRVDPAGRPVGPEVGSIRNHSKMPRCHEIRVSCCHEFRKVQEIERVKSIQNERVYGRDLGIIIVIVFSC